ncbi:MAG TPA: DUF2066 domain-containing protein [Lysobacter sp.]|jgi:hypothetical protein|nr:DUF2066 domain-containing protein [Lysobacter sp.]
MVRAFRGFWLAALLLASYTATAQRVEGDRAGAQGPYEAEVTVNGQGEVERNTGFARALSTVLGRLSGNRSVAAQLGVGQELRRAKDFVKSYDYRQDEGVGPTGAPTFNTSLIVRFDQAAVDDLIATLGLPVWPMPRPKPVLWLAIDDGSGPRLVGLDKANAARSALNRAKERGYSLGLPTGNAAEQATVGAIWRGDSAAVARASLRYSPPMQLIGKIYRSDAGWKADWTFVDSGKVLSSWSTSDVDARRLIAAGADGAADALTKRYAKRGTAGPAGSYAVTFTGIHSSDDYIRLAGYLEKLAVVRKITPQRATPESVTFSLDLVTGLSGFRRMADRDGVIAADEGETPIYRLR